MFSKKDLEKIENSGLDGDGEVYNYSISQLQSMAKEPCTCCTGDCRRCWAEMELDRFRDSQFDHIADELQTEDE